MSRSVSAPGMIVTILIFLNAIIVRSAFTINDKWYWALFVTVPLLVFAISYFNQRRHSIKKAITK